MAPPCLAFNPFFMGLFGSQQLPSALQPGHVGACIADHNPYADLQLNLGRAQNGNPFNRSLSGCSA